MHINSQTNTNVHSRAHMQAYARKISNPSGPSLKDEYRFSDVSVEQLHGKYLTKAHAKLDSALERSNSTRLPGNTPLQRKPHNDKRFVHSSIELRAKFQSFPQNPTSLRIGTMDEQGAMIMDPTYEVMYLIPEI